MQGSRKAGKKGDRMGRKAGGTEMGKEESIHGRRKAGKEGDRKGRKEMVEQKEREGVKQ